MGDSGEGKREEEGERIIIFFLSFECNELDRK